MSIYLSVVIPAYNEEKRIGKTLESINGYLSKQNYSYEIIVVANNCTDRTDEVVKEYQKKISNLNLLDLGPSCPGKGCTVKEGIMKAQGEYLVFTDADNSTRIWEIEKFWKYFEQGYDIVIGSRDIKGAKVRISQSWYKELAGKLGNLLIQAVLLPGIWDTQCGFKAFKSEPAKKIFAQQKIKTWGFDLEVLALARKFGYKIKEVPITWYNDPESKVSLLSYFNTFKELFQIRLNLWTGKYNLS